MRMFRYASVATVLLVLTPYLHAAAPKVPGIALATVGAPTVVEIESPAAGVSVAWRETFLTDECYVGEMKPLRADTVRLIFIPKVPKVFAVVCWSGKEREDSALLFVDASGSAPVIPPPKKIDPVEPKPLPIPKALVEGRQFVVLLEDRLRSDPDANAAFAGERFRAWLKVNGHEFDVIDLSTDFGRARDAKYAVAYKTFGITENTPAIAFLSKDATATHPMGWVGAMVKRPKNETELMEVLKTVTGK